MVSISCTFHTLSSFHSRYNLFPLFLLLVFSSLSQKRVIVLNSQLYRYIYQYSIVLNRVKDQLNARGTNTIRGLGRAFRTIDSYDGNRKVDSQEFYVGMTEFGVRLSKAESDVSFIMSFRRPSSLF